MVAIVRLHHPCHKIADEGFAPCDKPLLLLRRVTHDPRWLASCFPTTIAPDLTTFSDRVYVIASRLVNE